MATPPARRLLRVYIDETGDRGVGPKASPFFAFSAVLVADEDEPHLMQAVRSLRQSFNIPPSNALHWNEHVKTFPRRQHVATVLGALTPVMVLHVAVEKAGIPSHAGMRNDHELFYNFAAGMVLEHGGSDHQAQLYAITATGTRAAMRRWIKKTLRKLSRR